MPFIMGYRRREEKIVRQRLSSWLPSGIGESGPLPTAIQGVPTSSPKDIGIALRDRTKPSAALSAMADSRHDCAHSALTGCCLFGNGAVRATANREFFQ
jgi:hypothetical protein